MFRRYYDYMLDDLEFHNYSRWLAATNSACYPVPDLGRVTRASRCDLYSLDYARQQYWMPQNWLFPSSEAVCFARRTERRPHHPKGFRFSRDKRTFAEERCFERDDATKFEKGKRGEFVQRFDRRPQHGWDKDSMPSSYHPAFQEERNSSRLSHRSSCIDFCGHDFFPGHQPRNPRQGFGESNSAADYMSQSHADVRADRSISGKSVPQESSSSLATGDPPDSKWRQQGLKASSSHLADNTGRESPKDFARSYESWYCPQEQQQIIDNLKEVNLRHDRQLRRDVLGSRCDESGSNDSSLLDCLHKSMSSEDDEDTINIILSPGGLISTLEEAIDEEEDLKPSYAEQSASDFFEEFQNIFTGSPEKQIFNDLTKETLHKAKSGSRDGSARGRRVSVEDRDAVRTALKFEDLEDGRVSSECKSDVAEAESNVSTKWRPEDDGRGNDILANPDDHRSALDALSRDREMESSLPDSRRVIGYRSKYVKDVEDINGNKVTVLNNYKTLDESPPKTLGNQQRFLASVQTRSMNKSSSKPSSASTPELMCHSPGGSSHPPAKPMNKEPCSQSKPPETKSGRQVSFSETYLDSRNAGITYRRISVNEIFKSISAESEKNKQILKQRQHYVNQIVGERKAGGTMSPSAHLKLILGIGGEDAKDNDKSFSKHPPLGKSTASEPSRPLPKSQSRELLDVANGSPKAKMSGKKEKHFSSTNKSKSKTDASESPSVGQIQNSTAANEAIPRTFTEKQKPKLSTNSEERTSEANNQLPPKDIKNAPTKTISESEETKKSIASPNSKSCWVRNKGFPRKSQSYEEIPDKSSGSKQYQTKVNSRNEKKDNVPEMDNLRNSKKAQNVKYSEQSSNVLNMHSKFTRENLSKCNDAQKVPHFAYDDAQKMPFQSSQQSPKPKRRFVYEKRRSKFSRRPDEKGASFNETEENYNGYQRGRWNKMYRESRSSYEKHPPCEVRYHFVETDSKNNDKGVRRKLNYKTKTNSFERMDLEELGESRNADRRESMRVAPRPLDNRLKPSESESGEKENFDLGGGNRSLKACHPAEGEVEDLECLSGAKPKTSDCCVNGSGVQDADTIKMNDLKDSSATSVKVEDKIAVRDLQSNNSRLVEPNHFASNALKQRLVQRLIEEVEKTGCSVKKLKLEFKRHRKRRDRLTIRYHVSKSEGLPSPLSSMFMDHVLVQKLTLSAHKLMMNDTVLPVVIVSTADNRNEGKGRHMVIFDDSAQSEHRDNVLCLTESNDLRLKKLSCYDSILLDVTRLCSTAMNRSDRFVEMGETG